MRLKAEFITFLDRKELKSNHPVLSQRMQKEGL